MPEQLALALTRDILSGRYVKGERLIETEIADHFSVSRGPVRDAFQLLARRRFITFEPRRGAFVREISVDSIADMFNARAALFSTAARFMAKFRPQEAMSLLAWRIEMLQVLAENSSLPASKFVDAVMQVRDAIVFGSGSELIAELLRDLNQHSIYADFWATTPQHFHMPEVRHRHVEFATMLGEAIQNGDSVRAGSVMRQTIDYNRNQIVGALEIVRNEKVSPSRML